MPSTVPSLPNPERVVFTPQEFATLFGRSKTWTYRLIYAGVIHPLKSTPTLMIRKRAPRCRTVFLDRQMMRERIGSLEV